MNAAFFIESLLLGVGLAMDAFSVSAVNGLNEPEMSKKKMCLIAAVFGLFQALMPLIGWYCVSVIADAFEAFRKMTPVIALVLLLYIGGKMLIDGIRGGDDEGKPAVGFGDLIIQGIATSIDALSVGFTIAEYSAGNALIAGLIIGVTTFILCMAALNAGNLISGRLKVKETTIGGIILILIGVKIWLDGIL